MSLNGPEAARLYDEHVDAIYAYAARRVGAQGAVEVVTDVFEHALRQNAERPAHTGTDLGWLLATATAFLRRHSETECQRLRNWTPPERATSRAVPLVTDPLLVGVAEDVSTVTTARVMAAVAELDPVERDLLFLIAWEGCSSSLAAVATGLPQNEVRGRLSTIRKEIRRRVADAERAAGADTATKPAAGPIPSHIPPAATDPAGGTDTAPPAATAAPASGTETRPPADTTAPADTTDTVAPAGDDDDITTQLPRVSWFLDGDDPGAPDGPENFGSSIDTDTENTDAAGGPLS